METYLGTKEDKKFIKSYLAKLRCIKPIHLIKTHNHYSLYTLLYSKRTELINKDIYYSIITYAEKYLNSIDVNFKLINPKDYYICYDFDCEDIGGFHGKIAGGYYYINNCGVSVLLNKKYINNENIITLELCKNYIHDSIHSSTFRAIRKMPKQGFTEYKVYREQYGLNFRKPSGISFSSLEATNKAPLSINLNLLMDGVTDLYAEKVLKLEPTNYNIVGSTELEVAIINQVLGFSYNNNLYKQPTKYLDDVISPTKLFINYWDKDNILLPLILKSMFTGNLIEIKNYFSNHLSNKDAWEIIFKRPNF